MARSLRYDPKQSAAMRNRSRFAGKRITGMGEAAKESSRFTTSDGRPTGPAARGSESRGIGSVPLTGIEVSPVTEGTGGMGGESRRKITGDDEGSKTIYARQGGPAGRAQQAAEGVVQQTEGALSPFLNYLGGKPTADELANQYGFALEGDRIRELALRALPATAAVGAVLGVGDLLTGGESLANDGMDLLGMGVGAYGMHRGAVGGTTRAGRALQYTGGAVAGKLGSDIIQLIAGGGGNSDAQLLAALAALQGGNV